MKIFKILIVFISLVATSVYANEKSLNGIQAGIILGEPTGLNFKYCLSTKQSIDLKIGWGKKEFAIHGDYLFLLNSYKQFDFYLGPGVELQAGSDAKLGIRCTGQVGFDIPNVPVNIFLEIAPTMNLDETDVDIHGGLGIRYIF